MLKLRAENHWDLFPGYWWPLQNVEIGTSPNIWRPFDHYNNGGYSIEDAKGKIAEVKIQDFFLHYGDDVLFTYLLDKNGDGTLDTSTEVIGRVLRRVSHDEHADLEPIIGEGQAKKDITRRYTYTFMAGSDWERRAVEFYLCDAMESFMVNEINRGFGKHSDLGWVNFHRSNILLLENPTVPNLGRALTTESSSVAKYDIVALLRAAGRDYMEPYLSTSAIPAYAPSTRTSTPAPSPVWTPTPQPTGTPSSSVAPLILASPTPNDCTE
ncbi:hypothetical protein HZB02_00760 [Candidatus Woesearchaeota archaeon]|nr:hypothetical protein [Candidatus Woesearchaeota archaeon]